MTFQSRLSERAPKPILVFLLVCQVALISGMFSACEILSPGLGKKVDITPPVLAITSPQPNSYLKGDITVSGSASDDRSIDSLVLSYLGANGSAVTETVAVADGSWSFTIPTRGGPTPTSDKVIGDGEQPITVTVADTSGKKSEAAVRFYVDNVAPSVLVTAPLTYGTAAPQNSDYIDIKGESYDQSPIANVKVSVYRPDGALLATQDADGTNTWSTRFWLKNQSAQGIVGLINSATEDGKTYAYRLTVTDKAGNVSTYYYHRADIYELSDAAGGLFPTMDEIGKIDQAGAGTGTISRISYVALSSKKLSNGSSPVYGDFKYMHTAAPDIKFTNLDRDGLQNANVLGVGAPVTGLITPPAGFGGIVMSSIIARIYTGNQTTHTLVSTLTNLDAPSGNISIVTVGDGASFVLFGGATKLSAGPYYIEVEAQAGGSATKIQKAEFLVDSAFPILDETSLGNGASFKNAQITLGGNATCTSELQSLLIDESKDGVTIATGIVVAGINGASGTVPWTSPALPIALANGVYDFKLTLLTVSGKTVSLYRTVTIDSSAPVVDIPLFGPIADLATTTVNGTVSWNASASDANGVIGTKYWVQTTATPAPASYATAGGTALAATNTINTTALSDNTNYTLWIITQDKAGNETRVSKAFQVNQSSNRPSISFSSLTAGATHTANNQGANLKLSGTIMDDDGIDTSKVYLGISADANKDGVPDSAFVFSPAQTVAATTVLGDGSVTQANFSQMLNAAPFNLAQGYYVLRVKVGDKYYAGTIATETDTTNTAWNQTDMEMFVVDTAPPALTIDQAQNQFQTATFTLSGTATDALGISGGQITVNGSPVTVTAGTWTTSINASAMAEGANSISISAMDLTGQTTNASFAFKKDTVAPTITLAPAVVTSLSGWQHNQNILISGTAADAGGANASGVAKIEYSLDGSTWLTLSGASSWSGIITVPNGAANYLRLRATDLSSNQALFDADSGTAGQQNTLVRVDDTAPTLAITLPAAYVAGTSGDSNSLINFSGTIGDNLILDAAAPLTVQRTKNGVAQSDVAVVPAAGSWSWNFAVDAGTHADDGTWVLTFLAMDGSGLTTSLTRTITVETRPPVITYNITPSAIGPDRFNGSVDLKAAVSDDNTVANVFWQVSASAAPAYTQTGTTISGAGWNLYGGANKNDFQNLGFDTTALTDNSTRYLSLVALDRFGNAALTSYTLTIDQSTDRPVLGFVNLTAGASHFSNNLGTTLVLNGTITDDDGVDRNRIYISVAADANQDGIPDSAFSFVAVSGKPSANGKSVSFSENLGPTGRNLAQGYYVLRVKVGDIYYPGSIGTEANTTIMSWHQSDIEQFVVDTAPPTITIDQAQNQYQGNSFTLSGTANDALGIAGSQILVNGSPVTVTAGAWSTTINATALAEGANSIAIVATDLTGQVANANFAFKKDSVAPSVTLVTDLTSAWLHSQNIAISGTAADPGGVNASGVAKIEYSIDGTTWSALNGTTAWNGVTTIPNGAANILRLRATDIAGNVSSISSTTVKVDDTAPSIAITLPAIYAAGTSGDSNATLSFAGTIGDNLTLDATAPLIVQRTKNGVLQSDIALLPVVGAWSWSFAVNTVTHADDGTWVLTFLAKDTSGLTSSITRTVTVETRAPVVTYNITPSVTGPDRFNGAVDLKASISDDNTVANVYWQVSSSAAPGYIQTGTTISGAGWNLYGGANKNDFQNLAFDTTSLTDNSTHYVSIVAIDRFGNAVLTSYTMSVEQSTDRPVLGFVNLTVGASYLTNNLGTTLVLNGTITDDDGVDKDKILIGVAADANQDGSPDAAFSFVAVSGKPAANGKSVSFSENLGPSGRNLAQGYYVLRVKVGDIYYTGTLATEASGTNMAWDQSSTEKFVVDTAPPTVTIDQAQNQFQGSSFTLSGTVTDALGIAGNQITVNGSPVTVVANVWTTTINALALSEGANSIAISVSDLTGQITNASFAFKKDSVLPTLTLSTDLSTWKTGNSLTVSGTAADPGGAAASGVQSVTLSIDGGTTWQTANLTGTGPWTWTTTLVLGEGTTTVQIKASDKASNSAVFDNDLGTAGTQHATVKVDTVLPTLLVTTPADALVTSNGIVLSGTSTDANLDRVQVNINAAGFVDATGFTGAGFAIANAALAVGSNTLIVKSLDLAGNSVNQTLTVYRDTTAPAVTFSNVSALNTTILTDSSPSVSGSITDASGVLSADSYVERWNGSSWTLIQTWTSLGSPGSVKTFNWTKDLNAAPFGGAEGRYRITVRSSDIASAVAPSAVNTTGAVIGGTESVIFKIDRSAPVLAITGPLANSYQSATLVILGTATDATNVSSVRVKIDSNDFGTGTIIGASSSGGIPVTADPATETLNANFNGLHNDQIVYVAATGFPGGLAALTRYYVVNAATNSVQLSATLGGAAIDITTVGTGVSIVQYDTGWTATVNITALSSGAHTFYVEARDGSGKTSLQSQVFYYDNTAPAVGFIYPAATSTVYGGITLRGTASDDIALNSVQLQIGKTHVIQSIPDASKYNWSYAMDTGSYIGNTHATETYAGSGVWQLDVDAIATDAAGNSTTTTLSFFIDNDQDKPKTTIITPVNADVIGGSFTVKGVATDGERVMGMEMQVEFEGVTYNSDRFDFWNGTAKSGGTTGDGDANDLFENRTSWYAINGTTSWDYDLNTVGELYKTYVQTKTTGIGSGTGATGRILIRVRAFDTKSTVPVYIRGVTGNYQQIIVTLNDNIPSITSITPANNGSVRGIFTLGASLSAPGGLDKLEVSTDGGQNYSAIIASAAGTSAYVTKTDAYNWILHDYPIDTTGYTGALNIRIRAVDVSVNKFTSISYLSLEADNTYPGNNGYVMASAVLGTANVLQGQALDSGSVGGLGRVELFVTDLANTTYYQLKGASATTTNSMPITVMDNTAADAIQAVNYPRDSASILVATPSSLTIGQFYYIETVGSTVFTNVGAAANTAGTVFQATATDAPGTGAVRTFTDNYRINIDRDEASIAADADGYYETLQLSAGVYNWSATVNSSYLSDGKYNLHYVIYDKAGNGRHYVKQIVVQNNLPTVSSIDLATDLNGDGDTVDTGEFLPFTSYGDTGFNVHGSRLTFSLNAANGNGTKFYAVHRLLSYTPATALTSGNLYRIKTSGTANFISVGASSNTVGTMFVATGTTAGGAGGEAYLVSSTLVNAGSFVAANTYWVNTVGTTDFTLIGAPTGTPASLKAGNSKGTYFTATGVGAGSGNAYLISNYLSGNGQTLSTFTGMPEDTANGTYFVLRVWDSTTGTTPGVDSLETGAVVHVTVDNTDGAQPQMAVTEIGQKYSTGATWTARTPGNVLSYDDNVLWTDTNANASRESNEPLQGHVELAGDSQYDNAGTTDADVSGIIKLRGKLQDNLKLNRVTVSFNTAFDLDGTGAGAATAANTEIDLATYASSALSPVAARLVALGSATNTLGFSVDDKNAPEQSNINGHVVNFTMTWNTAFITNTVATNVIMTFRVYDGVTAAVSQTRQVDVVPYIAKISTDAKRTTGGLKDANIRGSMGRYSVMTGADAAFLTMTGFNLNPIANGVRVASPTYKTGLNGTALQGSALAFSGVSTAFTSLSLTQNSTVSGWLSLVGGTAGAPVPSLNNINDNTKAYDQESDLYVNKNNKLYDDRYIQFYKVTDTGATYKNGYYPNMFLDASNNPVFGYTNLSAANDLQVRRTSFTLATGAMLSDEPVIRGTVWDQLAMARDSDSRYHLLSVHNRSGGRMAYMYNQYASLHGATANYGMGLTGAARPYWSNYDGNYYDNTANNAVTMDDVSIGGTFQSGRFMNPKMIALGQSNTAGQYATVYLAYYDASPQTLYFRNFRVGQAAGGNLMINTGAYANIRENLGDENGATTRFPVSASASSDFDMVVTSTNIVVVFYYNEATSKLCWRFSSTAAGGTTPQAVTGNAPTTTVNFSQEYSLAADSSYDYIGTNMSMIIDATNHIHIAAYDASNADLKYIYLDSYSDTVPDVVTVDQAFSVGLWTDIKLDSAGQPWISYYNNSENGTREAIKVAHFLGTMPTITAGVDSNGFVTQTWDFATVPTQKPAQGGLPQFRKVNLSFTSGNIPLIGYLGTNLEYSVPVAEAP